MQHNTDLTGKVAVITAAGSGIGMALAASAAERRMKLALIDHDEASLAVAVKQLRKSDAPVMAACAQMTDLTGTRRLAQRIERELGPAWLVCNHSERSVELNVQSVIHGVQVFAPALAQRGEGHIVNIMSADRCGASCPAFYTAARHAVVGISTSLYRELDCMGSPVGVSLVCPARMDWHQQILCSEQHNGVSRRATEALHPKRLADEIFAAINTRRFWLFCDKSRADSPDLLEIRGVRGAEPQSSAAERDRPSQRRRFRSQTTVRSSAAFDPLAGAGRTGQPYQGIRAGSIGR